MSTLLGQSILPKAVCFRGIYYSLYREQRDSACPLCLALPVFTHSEDTENIRRSTKPWSLVYLLEVSLVELVTSYMVYPFREPKEHGVKTFWKQPRGQSKSRGRKRTILAFWSQQTIEIVNRPSESNSNLPCQERSSNRVESPEWVAKSKTKNRRDTQVRIVINKKLSSPESLISPKVGHGAKESFLKIEPGWALVSRT